MNMIQSSGDITSLKKLLSEQIDFDGVLLAACKTGKMEVIQMLLQDGRVDKNKPTETIQQYGYEKYPRTILESPLSFACRSMNASSESRNTGLLQTLISGGVDANECA